MEQLEAMKAQLTFLHDMVHKLQEQHLVDLQNAAAAAAQSGGASAAHRQSRNLVPHEIELGGDSDDCDYEAYWNEPTYGDWTEHYQSSNGEDDGASSDDDDDEQTTSTFQVTYGAASIVAGDERTVGTMATRQSVVSTSKSVKTLPREIELEEDSSTESREGEAFDNRSHATSRRGSYKSFVSSLSRQTKPKEGGGNGPRSTKNSHKFSGTVGAARTVNRERHTKCKP